jgi:hypothetical protein
MATRSSDLYERDFYAWTRSQAVMLRRLRTVPTNLDLDLAHLIEEVWALGSELRHGLFSHVETVLEHLLKLEHSVQTMPRRGWMISVNHGRGQIERRLSASLRRKLERALPDLYRRARRDAALALEDYREPKAAACLPATCPYTIEQIIADEWYPPART